MARNLARHPRLREVADRVKGVVNDLNPAMRRQRDAVRAQRAETDQLLAELCKANAGTFEGKVLIDGQFDNPNYWFRVAIARAALGLPNGHETGLLGQYRQAEATGTFSRLGVNRTLSVSDIALDSAAIQRQTETLLAETESADDVLKWQLPGDVPGAIFYDTILKAQRLASVDIHAHDFRRLVVEGLEAVHRFQRILDEGTYDLVVVSHAFSYNYGALAWLALSRGIPVILPFGWLGVLRMAHMTQPAHITTFWDAPTVDDMASIPAEKAARLRHIGRNYLAQRLGGKANDIQAIQAFGKPDQTIDRSELVQGFGWDPAKPIVGVYASNWFDWPHQLGMTEFRDFLDWTHATFEAAAQNERVNWLFKPHPCERIFGGVALKDILGHQDTRKHVQIADFDWNNADVLRSIDGLVNYHGTAGIEIAALGKPVLLPDRGKYDQSGFARAAKDRRDYLALLQSEWWADIDLEKAQQFAELYAGICFCAPDWQKGFVLGDDPRQDALYPEISEQIRSQRPVIEREIECTRDWIASGSLHSHTYKMVQADHYIMSNIA